MDETLTTHTQRPPHRIGLWVKKYRTAIVAILFWLAFLVAIRSYMVVNNLTFNQLATQLQTVLMATWYGPLLYILVYWLRPVILFPASLLTILGGSVFGLWPGFIVVLIGGTLSANIPYSVGRWFSADNDAQETLGDSTFERFIGLLRRNPFQAVLMMRLLYLPYDAVSVLAGNLRIPFFTFLLATALGNVVGTLSFVGVGASIEGNWAEGQLRINPSMLIFSAVILVMSLGVSRLLGRRQSNTGETE